MAKRALVIGGGIAGPVAATALHLAGMRATVCEAYPGDSNGIGGDLALAPNGMDALAIIRADTAVREAALSISRQIIRIGEKSRIELPRLVGLPPQQMIERGTLQHILQERAKSVGVRFEYNKRLTSIVEEPDSVTARFADGSELMADLLIGADGVRSTVRRLIDPQAPGPGYTGILGFEGSATVPVDLPPHTIAFSFGKRAYYLYWQGKDDRVTWGANLPSPTYLTLKDARAIPASTWVQRLLETYGDDRPAAELIHRTSERDIQVHGAIHIMPSVPHWHSQRMVLVGDAVHAPSNSTGQGASLAIEGAIQLARCLRDVPDITSACASYERLCRHRVETIAARGAKTNQLKTPGPMTRKLMRAAMPLMFRVMDWEKSLGPEQRHKIEWNARVDAV
ncbi:MAG TPA: FAD-dependent monooxygenase [Rhodanobacteraceae bacterium]